MPDHWHALIGVSHPLTISRVVQSIKWISARRLNEKRRASGPVWQHQFWTDLCATRRNSLRGLTICTSTRCGGGLYASRKNGAGQATIISR
ncbi:MAG: transposase [Terriglobia bacterium]